MIRKKFINIIKKIKAFFKDLRVKLWGFFASNGDYDMEEELINRRDEVIQRAIYAANRQFPPSLIESGFPELLKWVINPHISEFYLNYSPEEEGREKKALRAVYKILEGVENEENNKEVDKE